MIPQAGERFCPTPSDMPWRQRSPHLQNYPVPFLGSHVQRILGHHLLSLTQGHVVEFPIVYGKSQFFP